MCSGMIDKFGNELQMTSTDIMDSNCLIEHNAGSDAASLQTKAVFNAATNSIFSTCECF